MSTIQLKRILKPEAQQRVDLVQEKPYVLVKWQMDGNGDFEVEEDIARSKTTNGLRAFARLNKLDKSFNYTIRREFIDEFVEGWYPLFSEETIEDL